MQKIKKGKARYLSAKKKKVSFFGQLQHQLSLKPSKSKNLHVCWTNKQGQECKKIIQPNRCFCTHSFQCHETPRTIGAAFCLSPGCRCKCFEYVPYYDIKCMCRHSYKDHDINTKMCRMCNKCLGFLTNWSCKCGMKYQLHHTVFTVKEPIPDLLMSKSERFEDHNEKQNQSPDLSLFISPKNDARSYQLAKYDFQVKQFLNKEENAEMHRKKQIKRINEKYSNLNYEHQVQNLNESLMKEGNKICKPGLARTVTPLELFIRPHRYVPVKLQEFLKKQYQKYNIKSQKNED